MARSIKTGFVVGLDAQDIGERYTTKEYLLEVYPHLVPGVIAPGIFTWGLNAYGQLALNDVVNRSSPTRVGSLTNWRQVSVGTNHTAAIKTDGTLWAWGDNSYGQLGIGNTTNRSSPVQVGSLNSWKLVSASSAILDGFF